MLNLYWAVPPKQSIVIAVPTAVSHWILIDEVSDSRRSLRVVRRNVSRGRSCVAVLSIASRRHRSTRLLWVSVGVVAWVEVVWMVLGWLVVGWMCGGGRGLHW